MDTDDDKADIYMNRVRPEKVKQLIRPDMLGGRRMEGVLMFYTVTFL